MFFLSYEMIFFVFLGKGRIIFAFRAFLYTFAVLCAMPKDLS